MDIKFSILLYSKYSKYSKEFISILEQSSTNIVETFNIKLLCIDNENIRKKILNSKQIDIQTVPCLLIIYQDGGVEKYEDLKAFQWLENIIQQLSHVVSQNPVSSQEIQKSPTYEEQIVEEKVEENDNSQPPPQKKNKKVIKKKPNQTTTPIEDLDSEEEEFIDNTDVEIIPTQIEQVESTNAMSAKKIDLMSMATSMQKSRDIFVEKTEKAKFGGVRS